jgi:hypothetical protein
MLRILQHDVEAVKDNTFFDGLSSIIICSPAESFWENALHSPALMANRSIVKEHGSASRSLGECCAFSTWARKTRLGLFMHGTGSSGEGGELNQGR